MPFIRWKNNYCFPPSCSLNKVVITLSKLHYLQLRDINTPYRGSACVSKRWPCTEVIIVIFFVPSRPTVLDRWNGHHTGRRCRPQLILYAQRLSLHRHSSLLVALQFCDHIPCVQGGRSPTTSVRIFHRHVAWGAQLTCITKGSRFTQTYRYVLAQTLISSLGRHDGSKPEFSSVQSWVTCWIKKDYNI